MPLTNFVNKVLHRPDRKGGASAARCSGKGVCRGDEFARHMLETKLVSHQLDEHPLNHRRQQLQILSPEQVDKTQVVGLDGEVEPTQALIASEHSPGHNKGPFLRLAVALFCRRKRTESKIDSETSTRRLLLQERGPKSEGAGSG